MTKTLQFQNETINYRVFGEGKPVVLIHGFGEDGTVWSTQIDSLKGKCKLIIPDLPGSGQSPVVNDMSLEALAEMIHAIILEEKINSCSIIGHSMGGYITLAIAEKYPDQINSFGLFHSSSFADNEEKKATRRKGIEFINEHGPTEFLKTMIPKLYSQATKDEMPELIDKHLASAHNFSGPALVSYYNAMIERPDRTELLRKAVVPVLFVMGKYDTAVPVEDTLQQCHLPEKSYIHMLDKSGHMGMREEAEKSNLIIEEFLVNI